MTATTGLEGEVLVAQEITERRRPARRRRSLPRKTVIWQIVLYVALSALALIYIYPFLVQVATSFKTDASAAADPISLVPSPFTWAAYEQLFLRSNFPDRKSTRLNYST